MPEEGGVAGQEEPGSDGAREQSGVVRQATGSWYATHKALVATGESLERPRGRFHLSQHLNVRETLKNASVQALLDLVKVRRLVDAVSDPDVCGDT